MTGQLHVVDPATGELRQPGCNACAEHVARIAGLQGDLENTQAENTRLLRKVRALERDRDQEREQDPQRDEIHAIFDHWRRQCRHPNARFDGHRVDLIKRALRRFTGEEIRMAIDGAAQAAYVDASGKRHDQLGLVLRNAEKIEDFCNRAARARSKTR